MKQCETHPVPTTLTTALPVGVVVVASVAAVR